MTPGWHGCQWNLKLTGSVALLEMSNTMCVYRYLGYQQLIYSALLVV